VIEVPLKDVQIGAADAHASHAQQGFPIARLRHGRRASFERAVTSIERCFHLQIQEQ
jgi:hypothetical protein